MQYIKTPYIDACDGIPATLAPTRNGPKVPPGVTVTAVDMRPRPVVILGTMADGATVPSYATALTADDYNAAMADLAAWQASVKKAFDADLVARLANYRFGVETAGIDIDGMHVLTDRESQAQLNGARQALTSGFVTSVDWKGAAGWASVTLDVINSIGAAVAQHVQACFTAERQVAEAIAAGTLETSIVAAFDSALAAIKASA